MGNHPLQTLVRQLRKLVTPERGEELTDAALLERFVGQRDEAAFEVLVWRHSALVLGVCRRVLRDRHEAEDAFQAAFLIFARKAGSISKHESVGGWLYRVAYRVALRARAAAAKRAGRLPADLDVPDPHDADEVEWRDLRPVLDEEVNRLPEKYRVPFVLCCLQGHTNEEAAQQLGCPTGTVLSRLSRGKDRLRSRLARRGIALAVGALIPGTGAVVAAPLVSATAKAATRFAAGQAASGLVSAKVATLTQGVLTAMFLTKLKVVAAGVLTVALLATGAGLVTQRVQAERPGQAEAEVNAAERARPARTEAATEAAGKVVAVAEDGKSFTVEVVSRGRGDEGQRVEVKLTEKTVITYAAVGPDGAQPTEGYDAQVRLEGGAALSVTFRGRADVPRRQFDFSGKVVAVARDGKGFTVETAARNRTDEARRIDVQLTDKSVLTFTAVPRDGARLTEGYEAHVRLAGNDRESTVAASVTLSGPERTERGRAEQRPDVAGKVIAVAADGKQFTVEAAAGRGEEVKKVEVKLTDKTVLVFNGVGPDGARLTVGYQALLWWEEGAKETAARLTLGAVQREATADVSGRVVGVGKDGKSLMIEQRAAARGEAAVTVEIMFTDRTRIAYFNVGPGEARPAEGYTAQVWLQEGATDTAAQVVMGKSGGERGR